MNNIEIAKLRADLWGIAGFSLISFEHYIVGIIFIVISIGASCQMREKYESE